MFKFLILCALALPLPAGACSICGCGDPMEASGQSLPMAGQWRLGIEWQQLSVRATSDEDPGRRDTLSQFVLAPSLSYSPLNSLNIALKLPWNEKSWASFGGAAVAEGGVTAGLGDLDLGLRWYFASSLDLAAHGARFAALTVGSTLNTGQNQLESQGLRIDEHDQPGTGSAGPYAGILLGQSAGDWRLVLHAGLFAHATNFSGYQYGSALKAGINLRKDLSQFHAFSLGLEGRYADYDKNAGMTVENSGGTLLEAVPALHFKLTQALGLSLKAQLPVFSNFFGGQEVAPSFSIALQCILN